MTCDFHTTTLRTCDGVRMRPHGHGHRTRPRITPIPHTSSHASARRISSQSARASSHAHDASSAMRTVDPAARRTSSTARSPAGARTRQSIAESRIRCRRRGDSSARRTTPATRCAGRREPGRCVAVHPLKAARPTRRRGYQGPAGASRPVQARKPWQARRAARHHRQKKGSTGWKARNQRHSTKREERRGGKERSAGKFCGNRPDLASITSPIRIAPVAGHKQVFTDSAVSNR